MACETTSRFGLTAVRLNGVVSIYEPGREEPLKQVTDSNKTLEAILILYYFNTRNFVGNCK